MITARARMELQETYNSKDDLISFFPFGGDHHDFDTENCLKFINKYIYIAIEEERKGFKDFLIRHRKQAKIAGDVLYFTEMDNALKHAQEYEQSAK